MRLHWLTISLLTGLFITLSAAASGYVVMIPVTGSTDPVVAQSPVNYAGLALLLLGIALIFAEAFVSGFGVLAIGGTISFVIGSIFLLKTDSIGLPVLLLLTIVVVLLLLFVATMALRSHRRPVVIGQEALIGQQAMIEVDEQQQLWLTLNGERWQCASDQTLVSGERVTVKALRGLTLVVTRSQ